VAKKIKKVKEPVSNGLTEALFGGGWNPNSGNTPGGYGVQLSQVNTLFKNNRWYLVSNYRQLLSEIYVEHGLVQAVVDVPVDDGLRGGVEIKTKQLDPEEIEDLYAEMDKQGDLTVVGQALKWNRLFGGAGVIIITDQDPKTPIDVSRITENSPLEFRAVDMWELFWDQQNTEGYNIETQQQQFEYYSYYATKLHKSRVMAMKGLTAPSFIRPRLRGWGFSIVEALVRSINQYLKANDLTFEVLDEFKLDVYKIKNLTQSLLSATGTEAIQRRVQIANMQKNYQNAISMDSEDDYLQKELSFAGLAETMTGIRMQVASDLRMPLTKIFGISAQGFNSGEDDIENYNAMVESQVRQKCKYDILKIIEIRCQKKFGFIPDDLQISFKPLRMLSAEQEENVKTQKFNRLLAAKTAGEIDSLEFRDACNKDQLLPIQLDTDKVMLNPDTEDGADESEGKAASGKPVSRNPRVAKPAKDSEDPPKEEE
jgi:phage-related protein (TIGR01555 family)